MSATTRAISEETDYPSLAALREALTTDDTDGRAEAYESVLNADVQASQALDSEPDKAVVQRLADNGVIPPSVTADQTGTVEHREQVRTLLERIAEAVEGS